MQKKPQPFDCGLAQGVYVVVVKSGEGRYHNRLLKF
jgi:hypothetical protein